MWSPHDWRLRKESDGWVVDPLDAAVTQLRFDYAATLHIDATIELRIEGPLEFFDGRTSNAIDPEDTSAVGPILALLHTRVRRLDLRASGRLTVEFDDDRWIHVGPDPAFESFQLTVPEERDSHWYFVGTIGEGVAVWEP